MANYAKTNIGNEGRVELHEKTFFNMELENQH